MKWIAFLSILLLTVSCKQNANTKTKETLDSISNAIDIEIYEEQAAKNKDSTKFTKKDWADFETSLTKTFKADIFNAYTPYALTLDSIVGYDLEDAEAFLYWLNELKKEQGVEQLTEAFSLLPFNEVDSMQLLVSSFISVVKSSNKTVISEAIANTIQKVVTSKAVTPNSLIEGIVTTLGANNFDKRICRLSAICYLLSMMQINPD